MRIIGWLLVVSGIVMLVDACMTNTETSIHQIYVRLGFLISAIEICAGFILVSLGSLSIELKRIQKIFNKQLNDSKEKESEKIIERKKNCPFCGEKIGIDETQCKFCGENLEKNTEV